MSNVRFDVDTVEAKKQLVGLAGLGRAYRWSLSRWASLVVLHIKRSRGRFFKTERKGVSGQLMRNVTFRQVDSSDTNPKVAIGTGLSGSTSVKYARIQEEGGTTHPQVTDRMRRWAWAMYYATGDDKFMGIALTKKSNLNIPIPPTGWFSTPIEEMTDLLRQMISPDEILRVLGKQISIGGE